MDHDFILSYEGAVKAGDQLIVGKYYNVLCARVKVGRTEFIVPIIGNIHSDNQFGFPLKHVHLDGRFLGTKSARHIKFNPLYGSSNSVFTVGEESGYRVQEFIIKRMLCKRLITGIDPPPKHLATNYWNWVDGMIGKPCKGKKCPHLGTEMIEKDGILVCPLHNLMSDVKGKTIVGAYSKY